MKRKSVYLKIVSLIILVSTVLCLTACSETITTKPDSEPVTETAKNGYTISVSVDAGEQGGYFGGGIYTYETRPTAYDALVSTGLEIEGSGHYVSGVNGLKELEYGPMSGWIYAVNGKTPSKNPGDYYLEDGDIVSWTYQIEEPSMK
ncbi:MAG: DUF4430 domain-containing protein [Parasporobacterium sp.]|nr:DUF4430 domain-containing protein [Parasporobacterium sp.]